MVSTAGNPLTGPDSAIRITGLNTDKTRRPSGSTTEYQVYFELSEIPSSAWREIFGQTWKSLNPAQEAAIDGAFLVMHCPLQEIATTYLPALKKAIESTNAAYRQYVQEQVTEEKRKADVWNEERKSVEDVARSLSFD